MMAKVRVNALILALLAGNLSSDLVTSQRNLSFGRFNISGLKETVPLVGLLRVFSKGYEYVNSLVSRGAPVLGVGDRTP